MKDKTRLKFIDFGIPQSVRLYFCHSLDSIASMKDKTRLKFIDFGIPQSVRLYFCHSLDSIASLYINNNKMEIN